MLSLKKGVSASDVVRVGSANQSKCLDFDRPTDCPKASSSKSNSQYLPPLFTSRRAVAGETTPPQIRPQQNTEQDRMRIIIVHCSRKMESSAPLNQQDNQSTLLHQAQSSAKRIVCEWIRQTLYEAFVEALQKTWTVTQPAPESVAGETNSNKRKFNNEERIDDQAVLRVEISHGSLQHAYTFVTQLAHLWQQKLRQAEQHQVVEWLQEVLVQGKATLWKKQEVSQEKTPRHNDEIEDNTTKLPAQTRTSPQDKQTEKSTPQQPPLAFARLRRLGERSAPLSLMGSSSSTLTDPTENALETIREMGRRGETYWPLDWNMIDTIIDKIPERLHTEKSSRPSSSSRKRGVKPTELKVIPKALWERQQQAQQQQPHDQEEKVGEHPDENPGHSSDGKVQTISQSDALTLLVNQKRDQRRCIPGTQQIKKSPPHEAHRPASDVSHERYTMEDIVASFSPYQRKYVDNLVHHDDAEQQQQEQQQQQLPHHTRGESPSVLFAALKSVGHIHYHIQKAHDGENAQNGRGVEQDSSIESLDVDRKLRREFGQSFLERLGPKEVEANVNPKRFRSKVLRTVNREDPDDFWWELDVGECIMEVQLASDHEEGGSRKRLCAFSSLEVSLKEDENHEDHASSDNTQSKQQLTSMQDAEKDNEYAKSVGLATI